MIRSILVASGGGASDAPVFATALAAAKPLGAHLDVLHLRPRLGEAALNTPHADMAMGLGLSKTLGDVEDEINRRSRASERHFHEFFQTHHVDIHDRPGRTDKVSASWHEVEGDSLECLTFAARHHDLLVIGRRTGANGMPRDLLELLLLRSGCPALVAPAAGRHSFAGTVLVGWRETPEAARALAAALPLLSKAERVILIGVHEDDPSTADLVKAGLEAAVGKLAWHGIDAEKQFIPAEGRLPQEVIAAAAEACAASLIVLGAYGHSRIREVLFGGCTQHFLRDEGAAVFLAH